MRRVCTGGGDLEIDAVHSEFGGQTSGKEVQARLAEPRFVGGQRQPDPDFGETLPKGSDGLQTTFCECLLVPRVEAESEVEIDDRRVVSIDDRRVGGRQTLWVGADDVERA